MLNFESVIILFLNYPFYFQLVLCCHFNVFMTVFSTIVHIETDLMQPENQMYAAENVDSASTKW